MAKAAEIKVAVSTEYSLSDLHLVTLWLSVIHPQQIEQGSLFTSSGDLWVKRQRMAHLPTRGDRLHLWGEDGDPLEGPMWGVRRRYWDAEGRAHLEFDRMVVDPGDGVRQSLMGTSDYAPWYTSSDDDPVPKLRTGGWSMRREMTRFRL